MKTLREAIHARRVLIGSISAIVITTQPYIHAALVFDLNSTTYSQNFDSMGVLGTSAAAANPLPSGWGLSIPAQTFADATTDTTRAAGTSGVGIVSSSSSGAAYTFVNGVVASGTDKSIGFLSSGSFSDNRNILFGFVNNTGGVITELSLSFDYEKYRSGTATRDWSFFGSTSDTSWGTALSAGAQSYAADAANTTVSNPPASVSKTVTISGLTLAAGANYYFRWNYDGSGTGSSGQALGLDNFALTATLGVAPTSLYFDANGITAGIGGTGTWDTTTSNWTTAVAGDIATTTFSAASPVTFGGTAGTVTIDAGGVTANGGIQVDTDGYVFAGGTLTLGNPNINTAHATGTTTIQSVIAGSSGLQKLGAGALVLTGTNTFTGTVAINAGILKVGADANLGATTNAVQLGGGKLETTASITLDAGRGLSGNGALVVGAGQTLTVPGAVTASAVALEGTGTLALSGNSATISALTVAGTGTVALTGTSPVITAITMSGAGTISSTNAVLNNGITTTHTSGTATISAPLDFGSASRNITVADGAASVDLLLSGPLTMTGTGRLIKLGDGTLELSGANSIPGLQLGLAGTTPANGGRVIISDADDIGTLTTASVFRFNAGTLEVKGGPLTLPHGASIGAGQIGDGAKFEGQPLTFQNVSSLFKGTGSYQHKITANANVTFEGGLNASGGSGTSTGLTIAGTGTVSLPAAANTITENITVDGGNLEISGSLTGTTIPTITTQNLGILSGNSTGAGIGEVIVGANGLVDPGTAADGTGTLNIRNFTVQSTGGLNFDIGGIALGDSDQINVTGTVTLSGSLIASLVNSYIPGSTDTIMIIANDGGDEVVGTFDGLAQMSAVGATGLFINYSGGDGNDVVLTAVPEPGSAAMLLGGLGILAASRRRRR